MNKLELAQEIYEKQQKLVNNSIIQGHHISVHYGITSGLNFSAWLQGTDSSKSPKFNANLEVVANKDYPESIDEARAALKEFLESEV
jgi:hypothetical protein